MIRKFSRSNEDNKTIVLRDCKQFVVELKLAREESGSLTIQSESDYVERVAREIIRGLSVIYSPPLECWLQFKYPPRTGDVFYMEKFKGILTIDDDGKLKVEFTQMVGASMLRQYFAYGIGIATIKPPKMIHYYPRTNPIEVDQDSD